MWQGRRYGPAMLSRIAVTALLVAVAVQGRADVVLLKDKASVTGRILAEKKEQVVVDVGYTVLLIPRSQIVKLSKEKDPVRSPDKELTGPGSETPATSAGASASSPASSSSPAASTGTGSELFRSARLGGVEKSVRDMVAQLGEAVAQVRTPGGLGSGFFLNEEGYLITNFHVIEGETQIAVEVYHQLGGQLERKIYKQVRIIAMNKFQDLALLKVEDKEAPKFSC